MNLKMKKNQVANKEQAVVDLSDSFVQSASKNQEHEDKKLNDHKQTENNESLEQVTPNKKHESKVTKEDKLNGEKYAIEIFDFTKKFKKQVAVDNISMQVSRGKIHGFIGPNGSGKTTTIKSLIGAMIPTHGNFYINGLKATSLEAKEILGYIPENARFPKHLNVYQYIKEMAFLRGLTLKESTEKAKKILENLDLWKFRKKNPNKFSSGMKKKVLLAQALITNPEILVLDEPAANLDPTARAELFSDLIKVRDQGKTILICSHILSELQEIADEITILNFGKIAYAGDIINSDKKLFEMIVDTPVNKEKLLKILKHHNFKIIEATTTSLIVHLPLSRLPENVTNEVFDNRIMIHQTKPHISNISQIYDEVVFHQNLNFGKASAVLDQDITKKLA